MKKYEQAPQCLYLTVHFGTFMTFNMSLSPLLTMSFSSRQGISSQLLIPFVKMLISSYMFICLFMSLNRSQNMSSTCRDPWGPWRRKMRAVALYTCPHKTMMFSRSGKDLWAISKETSYHRIDTCQPGWHGYFDATLWLVFPLLY